MSPTLKELLEPKLFLARLFWATMTLGIALHLVVAYYVIRTAAPPGPLQGGFLPLAGVISIAFAALSLALPRILLTDARILEFLRHEQDARHLATDALGRVDHEQLRKLESLSRFELKLVALPAFLRAPFVLCLVLNLCIAIPGLSLSLMTRRVISGLPFIGLAIALNCYRYPRIDPYIERAIALAEGGDQPRQGKG